MMTAIPSDFDYSVLFSDTTIPASDPVPYGFEDDIPPSDIYADSDTQQLPPASDSFQDDVEAINEVQNERREELNRRGIVIQHRLWDERPLAIFRSSSLPPDSPTPRRNRNQQHQQHPTPSRYQESSPTKRPFEQAKAIFRSSPPPADMLEDTNTTAIGDDAPVTPKRTTPPTVKTFVPNFILPLSGGGLFSRKIASKETPAVFGSRFGTKPTAATDTNEVEESSSWAAAPSPTPSPPPTTRISTFVPPKPTRPESSSWTVPAPPVSKAPEFVKIVTSSADVFEVRYRDETYSAEKADAALSKPPAVDPPSKKNYFGVDIHGLLDQYNNEKAKAAAAASATGLSTAATAELEKANQGPAPALPPKKNEMLWSEKYRAKKFTDLVGDERTHRDVLRWLTTWDKIVFPGQQRAAAAKRKPVVPGEFVPPHKKILLLHGPPGLGKTTLAHVAARQAGYEPFEINASDDRSGGVVKGKIKDMLTIEGVKSAGITCGKKKLNLGKPVCLVVDEIDGVTGGATAGSTEGGFVKSLIDLILEDQKTVASAGHNGQKKKGKGKSMDRFRLLRPIIAVCNDAYSPNLKPLRQYAEVVVMRVPPESLLIERLDWVFDQEGYATEDGASRRIVELSSMGNSGRKGDMRAALVNGEWIAARVRQEAIASGGNSTGRIFLTRKAVEDELAGSRFGNSDGKGSSGGRLVMNDVVDSVFHNAKEPQSRCGPRGIKKTTTAQKVQEIVEAIGEYDKIIMDCFSAYPTKAFNDDRVLSKPDYAYEWLFFADIVGPKVYNARESSYLTYPILAFHMLFAADGAPVKEPWVTDTDPSPFTGVTASWDAFNAEKEHSSMITTVHRSLAGPRLSQTFKSQSSIIMELAPLVNRMLSPQITPVQLVVSGFHHAAVRRDSEKRMVARAIDVMDAVGVTFEKVRVEVAPGVVVGSGWAYRMDPPLDALDLYSTLSGTRDPPRYAVRQVLEQEWKRAQALKEKEAREKRMGALSEKWAPAISAAAAAKQKELPGLPKAKVKRDFFGREIVDMGDADGGGPRKKRRRAGEEEKRNVWVSFNEGFSNAVRKGIRLDELMDGLI